MHRQDDLCAEFGPPRNCRVEVIDLEPRQHAVAARLGVRISDGAMVVLDVPSMQLEDETLATVLCALPVRSTRRS